MVSPVTRCTMMSEFSYEGGRCITSIHQTTPEEFEEMRANTPSYQLTDGARCGYTTLAVAAMRGNIRLIEHVVRTGGKELLELGDDFGATPLFVAIEENQTQAAKKLILLGSNVNMATNLDCPKRKEQHVPPGATPLWAAAERAKSIALVKLLLRNGAVAEPALTAAGTAILARAEIEMEKEKKELLAMIDAHTEHKIPLPIVSIITDYADHIETDPVETYPPYIPAPTAGQGFVKRQDPTCVLS